MLPAYYQQLKIVIIEILSVSRDAIHIHVGFAALILTLLITQKKLNQWSILLPTFLLSVLMEALDVWDELNTIGRILYAASVHDLINTNLIPFILVLWARKQSKVFT